ncbi:hypothetical protein TEA_002506 [Camellia sinensis var. sinensis]|uniref:Uncharacterized protein n=1 Tax=Camellia sinensis var. sinensis TaxID=542762 RepID=A0A4S4EJ00_CAMSN|nr:hypothetical protein TEA_002506 [Camellia sinensis var. sinensis]
MSPHVIDDFEEELEAVATLAEDVKEGHFAVFAVKGGVPKRFIVELSCLADPAFLCLLEKAKEEYGFMQKDHIPCANSFLVSMGGDQLRWQAVHACVNSFRVSLRGSLNVIAPNWVQALTLKKTVDDQITKDGVIGIGITATDVGLVAGGIAASLARKY